MSSQAAPAVSYIEPCLPDDHRFERWVELACAAMSPRPAVRDGAAATLAEIGFVCDVGPAGGGRTAAGPRRDLPGGGLGASMLLAAIWLASSPLAASGPSRRKRRAKQAGREFCGLPTATGKPCANYADTCPNKSQHRRYRYSRRGLAAAARDPGFGASLGDVEALHAVGEVHAHIPATLDDPGDAPTAVSAAARTLDAASLGRTPPSAAAPQAPRTAPMSQLHENILRALGEQPYGFTIDPGNPSLKHQPSSGIPIAFDHTCLIWDQDQAGPAFDPAGLPTQALRLHVRDWVRDFAPTIAAGRVWIGAWTDPETRCPEINLSYVFRPEHRNAARVFGGLQAQAAGYDLDRGEDIPTYGGNDSPWVPFAQRHARAASTA